MAIRAALRRQRTKQRVQTRTLAWYGRKAGRQGVARPRWSKRAVRRPFEEGRTKQDHTDAMETCLVWKVLAQMTDLGDLRGGPGILVRNSWRSRCQWRALFPKRVCATIDRVNKDNQRVPSSHRDKHGEMAVEHGDERPVGCCWVCGDRIREAIKKQDQHGSTTSIGAQNIHVCWVMVSLSGANREGWPFLIDEHPHIIPRISSQIVLLQYGLCMIKA